MSNLVTRATKYHKFKGSDRLLSITYLSLAFAAFTADLKEPKYLLPTQATKEQFLLWA